MSWIFCRKSAPRPEPRFAQEPPGLAPFSRLFRFSASVDHQMTPALFRPLFRAVALSRPSLADWLSGTPSAALRPKASSGLRTRGRVIFLREKRRLPRRGASGVRLLPAKRPGRIAFPYYPRQAYREHRRRWWLFEALPPETKLLKNARGASAPRQKLALRVSARGPCEPRDGEPTGTETPAFPKSRADSESGELRVPAGLPAGDGRGCSVGRQPQAAPAFPRLEDSPLEK